MHLGMSVHVPSAWHCGTWHQVCERWFWAIIRFWLQYVVPAPRAHHRAGVPNIWLTAIPRETWTCLILGWWKEKWWLYNLGKWRSPPHRPASFLLDDLPFSLQTLRGLGSHFYWEQYQAVPLPHFAFSNVGALSLQNQTTTIWFPFLILTWWPYTLIDRA